LRGALGEVEGEGGLFGAKVVDIENEVLRKIFSRAPYHPPNAGVYEAVLDNSSVRRRITLLA
jgi:hypothetical protein